MVANPGLGCQLSLGRTPTAGRVPKRISVRRGRGHRGVSSRDPLPQASSCPVPAKRWLNGHPALRKRLKGLEPIDGRPPLAGPPANLGNKRAKVPPVIGGQASTIVQAGSGLWRFSSSSVADARLKHVRSMPSSFFCIEPHLMLGLGRPGIATASHEGTRTPSHRTMVSTPKQGCPRGRRCVTAASCHSPHGLHSATSSHRR